jgi:hypothetical protein
MKKILSILFLLPLMVVAQKSFTVTGTVTGIANGTTVYIYNEEIGSDTIAKAKVTNGKFVLKGSVAEPALYYLAFAGNTKRCYIFMDNNPMVFAGDIKTLDKSTVTGSQVHTEFKEMTKTFDPLLNKLNELGAAYNSTQDAQKKDSLFTSIRSIVEKIDLNVSGYIQKKQGSDVSALILLITSNLSQDYQLLGQRFNSLEPMVQESFYGRIVRSIVGSY